jgi:nondiscriminating aspartyl-tRNA synthetase
MESSKAPEDPKAQAPAQAPEAAAPADGAGEQSKKGAKKAAAKAAKEAEKARKAAEREAAQAAQNANKSTEDLAKDNYGQLPKEGKKLDAPRVGLEEIGEQHLGQTIQIRGWIQNSRMQGAKMAFIELRKRGDWTIQGVVAANPEGTPVSKQMVKWVGSLNLESLVLLEAKVQKPLEPVKSTRVSGFELHITKCYLVAAAPVNLGMSLATASIAVGRVEEEEDANVSEALEGMFPLLGITLSADFILTDSLGLNVSEGTPIASLSTHLNNPVIHKRAPVNQAIATIRFEVQKLFMEYLNANRFEKFEAPGLIEAASEGGANVFAMPYFGRSAYLAQSPQFYKQIEIAGGRERVYCIGPVYRAENSNTPRHMTEFTGLDLEMEIEEHYHEVRDTLEGVLLHIFKGLETRCASQIELVRSVYPSEPFLLPEPGKEVRLTFAEGQKLLREEGPEEFRNVSDDEDMSTPQEKALGALVRAKFNTDFYVLDKFPESARPFYTMVDPANPAVTNAFDFMMRGQEILSGGQRLHLPEELVARIRQKGVDPESAGIKEYVDHFRAVGVPPHGGGGIGLDRVVAWYLQLPSVHLACAFPRTPKRLYP